jgi:hypothetical protein
LNGAIPEQYRKAEVWQSVIAECGFRGGQLRSLRLDPVVLSKDGTLDGNPSLANGVEAKEILSRLQALSAKSGTRVDVKGGYAQIDL